MIAFLESPAIISLVNGYIPFMPDAGIYCGGYQGPLYPNPLVFKDGLNINLYLEARYPIALDYIMKNDGDIYNSGFPKGCPGIEYTNPGHLLGLIDTYTRMLYGLGIIKLAREGHLGFNISPIINVENIPAKRLGGNNDTGIKISDIYPESSEIPSDYLKGFIDIDGNLILDPKTNLPFIFTDKYKPSTGKINWKNLFLNVDLNSYFGIPEFFENIINAVHESISDFNEKKIIDLDPEQAPWSTNGLVDSLPNPIIDPAIFPHGLENLDENLPSGGFYGLSNYGQLQYLTKSHVLNSQQSLKLMTGSENFHRINIPGDPTTKYEYRSLNELNSFINTVPIQTHGMKYNVNIETVGGGSPVFIGKTNYYNTSHAQYLALLASSPNCAVSAPDGFWEPMCELVGKKEGVRCSFALLCFDQLEHGVYTTFPYVGGVLYTSFFITDICFTTLINNPVTINVTGKFIANEDINGTFFPRQNLLRQMIVKSSQTNRFIWDRKWYDLENEEDISVKTIDEFMVSPGILNAVPELESVLMTQESEFLESIILPAHDYSRTIRTRIIIKSRVLTDSSQPLFQGYENISLQLNIETGGSNILYNYEQ